MHAEVTERQGGREDELRNAEHIGDARGIAQVLFVRACFISAISLWLLAY
jgi:hypothetical protein